MHAPCKDCQDRAPHCHGGCQKYAEFKAAKEAVNARRRAECEATDAVITSKLRMVKIANKQKRR